MRWQRFAFSRGRLIGALWGWLGAAQFYLAADSARANRLGFAALGVLWLGLGTYSWVRPDLWTSGRNFHRRDYRPVAVLLGSLALSIAVLWAFRVV